MVFNNKNDKSIIEMFQTILPAPISIKYITLPEFRKRCRNQYIYFFYIYGTYMKLESIYIISHYPNIHHDAIYSKIDINMRTDIFNWNDRCDIHCYDDIIRLICDHDHRVYYKTLTTILFQDKRSISEYIKKYPMWYQEKLLKIVDNDVLNRNFKLN